MQGPSTCKDFYCVLFQLWLLPGFTALPNVALSGTASQSTELLGCPASKAIDGNRNPYWAECATTLIGPKHWWRVRLPAVYRITSINVTNTILIPEAINGAKILIGNSQENDGVDNPICAVIESIPSASTSTFHCGGLVGRWVYVNLVTHLVGWLTLCEVEVYGELATPWPFYRAVLMGRNIVVVEKKLCWSDALFYCRDFYWDLLSIRSEEEQREVEEVLRNTDFLLTKHVWLGLRRYLMDSKWFWMVGDSMDSSHWETENIWQNTDPCAGIDTSNQFHWRDLHCGDHLHFICLTDFQNNDKRVKFFSSKRP